MRHATHTFSRRLGALLLCLALLAGLLPMSALAAETEGVIYNVKYIDENGEERICKAATVVTSGTAPITVKGDVRLILAGGLHAIGGGIDVSAGNSLTIYSQAGSSDYVDVTNTGGVAIGSTEGCGTIAIHGGKVKGGGEVGIGGPGGRVTITGGSVTASQSIRPSAGITSTSTGTPCHCEVRHDRRGHRRPKGLSGNDFRGQKKPVITGFSKA